MNKRIHKSQNDKKLGGVCAGLAESFNIDISVVRIITFFLCAAYPPFIIAYLVLAATMPKDIPGEDYSTDDEKLQADILEDNNCYSRSGGVFFAFILLAAFGLVLYRFAFGQLLNLRKILAVYLFTIGLYILFSGITDRTSQESAKAAKITSGLILMFSVVSRFLYTIGHVVLGLDLILSSVFYIWPLLILGVGVTLIFPNKKTALKTWVVILILLICYALYSAFKLAGILF